MTSKEKMFAVMDGAEATEFPVVIPYLGIFLRDHWEEVTEVPWWAVRTGDIEANLQVAKDMQEKLAIDWIPADGGYSREWREKHEVKVRGKQPFIVDRETGQEWAIHREPPGGTQTPVTTSRVHSIEDIDRMADIHPTEDRIKDGSLDYAAAVVRKFGDEYFIFASIGAPFWGLQGYFGFYEMMTNLIERPEWVKRLTERITVASLETLKAYAQIGIDGVWVEDCYSSADLISLAHFRRFAAPYVKRQIELINELGMKSIYYFCGGVSDRLEDLVQMNPTCISLEESKKNFVIEIDEVDKIIAGRACLFGNVDAIGVLQNGSREIMATEIERQIEVARRSGRFVMSLGSPVTPLTPTAKVREFVDLTRDIARLQ
ncbi:MAG: uroporphyrinogen decarboxylase family protein [Candidatus Poribacteria bacterium]